jgi:hypothetical protein
MRRLHFARLLRDPSCSIRMRLLDVRWREKKEKRGHRRAAEYKARLIHKATLPP